LIFLASNVRPCSEECFKPVFTTPWNRLVIPLALYIPFMLENATAHTFSTAPPEFCYEQASKVVVQVHCIFKHEWKIKSYKEQE